VTHLLALSGSLQAHSSNTALVHLARALGNVEVFDGLADLPYFNPDLDVEPPPAAVAEWRRRVQAADGLLIASPEYAHEMPGVLKNALDWLVSSGELYDKRVVVLCAAPSAERGGYVRAALARTLGAQGAEVVVSETVVRRGEATTAAVRAR
jgi:NAD(P)H-dependent FMN reductase